MMRWGSRLELLLGDGYRVQEEGLCGRSTVFDDPVTEGRNGQEHYYVCYESARPVELVIFLLGTNDVRPIFQASPEVITLGMERLGILTERFSREAGVKTPRILMIAPVPVEEGVEHTEFAGFTMRAPWKKAGGWRSFTRRWPKTMAGIF